MSTIHTFFETQAASVPEHIAVICDNQSLTYRELNEKSNQIGHYLREVGVGPDVQVALCMERSIDLLCIILGVLKAGGAYVPLDVSHPEARLLWALNENKTPVLITRSYFEEKFTQYSGQLIAYHQDETDLTSYPLHNLDPIATAQHLAYVIYTSGSTGAPKGVLIEHQSVINYCHWFAEYSGCVSPQRVDFSSNHIFDMVVTISIVPLMLGLTVVICADDEIKKNVRHYLNYLEYHEVNVIKLTPSFFKILLYEVKSRFVELPHLRSIILGGENLPAEDCRAWLELYPNHILHNEYGPTEATVGISQYQMSAAFPPPDTLSVPIGKPGPNMTCYILDADHQLVPEGEMGELYIGGICLARGYLHQPELTQRQFIQNPFTNQENARLYKTGDLARRLPDGSIEYLGRIDHQLKIRGFRIEPGEIERCLELHPAILSAAVLAQEDEHHEKRLIAYYILDSCKTKPTVQSIREYLEQHLPEYMIPSALVSLDAFPLTSNGKLDRKALPVPQLTTKQHYVAPSSELESTIVGIWAEELGLKVIGVEDNFFELGGHSLSAARIISKINTTLEKDITLHDFYLALTIKQLAVTVAHAKNVETLSVDQRFAGPYALLPLSDFQLMLWLSNTFEPKATQLNIFSRKRLDGKIDPIILMKAFQCIINKHEILQYQVMKLRPAQRVQKSPVFELEEKDIGSLSDIEVEAMLNVSADEMIHHVWKKKNVWVKARLFHLRDAVSELQISMSHLIADDLSPEILFSDLSLAYEDIQSQQAPLATSPDRRYRDYLQHEQHYSLGAMNRDILFWDSYLEDACLFDFPPERIIKNMVKEGAPYSSYLPIPEKKLMRLQQFCAENQVSINDGLCAILGLALVHCCGSYYEGNKTIFMNVIKSTRENHWYDRTIGCFLRLDPIKVTLGQHISLVDLAKNVHESMIATAPFRRCFGLVKLASVSAFRRNRKLISKYVFHLFSYVYTIIFRAPQINRKVLQLCGRLAVFERKNEFLINVNVWNNFISQGNKTASAQYFGLKPRKVKLNHYDLLSIENILEVCFLRDDSLNTPYIVISANLEPHFREQIAKEMIQILTSETNRTTL